MIVRRFVAAGAVAGMAMFGAVAPTAQAFDGGASVQGITAGVVIQKQPYRIIKAAGDPPSLTIVSKNAAGSVTREFPSRSEVENGITYYTWPGTLTDGQQGTDRMFVGIAQITSTSGFALGAVAVVGTDPNPS